MLILIIYIELDLFNKYILDKFSISSATIIISWYINVVIIISLTNIFLSLEIIVLNIYKMFNKGSDKYY